MAFGRVLTVTLGGHTLPFDDTAANVFGRLTADRQKAGYNTQLLDFMIAAIAISHKATLATRNSRDFEGCGIELINPWLDP